MASFATFDAVDSDVEAEDDLFFGTYDRNNIFPEISKLIIPYFECIILLSVEFV